jgi:hypothetical protein
MTYELIETSKGTLANTIFSADEKINDYRSFFDAIMESPSDTTIIEKDIITDEFFNLRSGLAGDVLQKVSTYSRRLIILGDFSFIESKSLKDFIYESNKTGKVIFCDTMEKAIELLK